MTNIVLPTADITGVNATVTDNGDDTYRIEGTDNTGDMYGYLRMSNTGESGDLTEDVSVGKSMIVKWKQKVSDLSLYCECQGWGIDPQYNTATGVWEEKEAEVIADGDIDTMFTLFAGASGGTVGNVIDFDMAYFSIEPKYAEFPESISCVVTKGYVEKSPFRKKYLGNQFGDASPAEIGVSAITETNSDIQAFERWYLDNGHASFTISLPLFGVERDWNVRFAAPVDTSLLGSEGREIPMKLVLVDDVSDYI